MDREVQTVVAKLIQWHIFWAGKFNGCHERHPACKPVTLYTTKCTYQIKNHQAAKQGKSPCPGGLAPEATQWTVMMALSQVISVAFCLLQRSWFHQVNRHWQNERLPLLPKPHQIQTGFRVLREMTIRKAQTLHIAISTYILFNGHAFCILGGRGLSMGMHYVKHSRVESVALLFCDSA